MNSNCISRFAIPHGDVYITITLLYWDHYPGTLLFVHQGRITYIRASKMIGLDWITWEGIRLDYTEVYQHSSQCICPWWHALLHLKNRFNNVTGSDNVILPFRHQTVISPLSGGYWNHCPGTLSLTNFSVVTQYDDIDLVRHWPRQSLIAWRQQDIAWTNVDQSSVRSREIHLRAILQKSSRYL